MSTQFIGASWPTIADVDDEEYPASFWSGFHRGPDIDQPKNGVEVFANDEQVPAETRFDRSGK